MAADDLSVHRLTHVYTAKDFKALLSRLPWHDRFPCSLGDWFYLPRGTELWFAFRPLGSGYVYIVPPDEHASYLFGGSRSLRMASKKRFIPPASKPKSERSSAPDCLDQLFGESYPMLWGYLSCHADAAGSPRETATLNVFTSDDGGFKAYLHDRQEGQKLWAVADTFMGLCERLETDLGDGTAHWREDWHGKTGKRKK